MSPGLNPSQGRSAKHPRRHRTGYGRGGCLQSKCVTNAILAPSYRLSLSIKEAPALAPCSLLVVIASEGQTTGSAADQQQAPPRTRPWWPRILGLRVSPANAYRAGPNARPPSRRRAAALAAPDAQARPQLCTLPRAASAGALTAHRPALARSDVAAQASAGESFEFEGALLQEVRAGQSGFATRLQVHQGAARRGAEGAQEGDTVSVTYATVVDGGDGAAVTELVPPEEPLTFEVGASSALGNPLFQAFDRAVRGLRVGDTAVVQAQGGALADRRSRARSLPANLLRWSLPRRRVRQGAAVCGAALSPGDCALGGCRCNRRRPQRGPGGAAGQRKRRSAAASGRPGGSAGL